METFLRLIPRLRDAGVEFVIIGGVAAITHGSVRQTFDLDVAAPMALENLQALVGALADLHPKFRMRPDLPVVTPENRNLRGLKNLYLTTDMGPLDVLGLVEGVGDYSVVRALASECDLGEGIGKCNVLNLDALISAKRAANRPKDHPTIAELEVIRRRLQGGPPPPMPGSIKTPDSDQPPDPRA